MISHFSAFLFHETPQYPYNKFLFFFSSLFEFAFFPLQPQESQLVLRVTEAERAWKKFQGPQEQDIETFFKMAHIEKYKYFGIVET